MAVQYAGERRQFGRVIGANQALAHLLADAAVLVEACRSASGTRRGPSTASGPPVPATRRCRQKPSAGRLLARSSRSRCKRTAASPSPGSTRCTCCCAGCCSTARPSGRREPFMRPSPSGGWRPPRSPLSRRSRGFRRSGGRGAGGAELRRFCRRGGVSRAAYATGSAPTLQTCCRQTATSVWRRCIDWHRALAGAGFVGVSFAPEYGGHGLSLLYDAIVNDELAAAGRAARARRSTTSPMPSGFSAARSRSASICPGCSTARCVGVRASASRAPDPTWPR